jgi:hypothetical protein
MKQQFFKLRYTKVTLKNNSKGTDEATAASENDWLTWGKSEYEINGSRSGILAYLF